MTKSLPPPSSIMACISYQGANHGNHFFAKYVCISCVINLFEISTYKCASQAHVSCVIIAHIHVLSHCNRTHGYFCRSAITTPADSSFLIPLWQVKSLFFEFPIASDLAADRFQLQIIATLLGPLEIAVATSARQPGCSIVSLLGPHTKQAIPQRPSLY